MNKHLPLVVSFVLLGSVPTGSASNYGTDGRHMRTAYAYGISGHRHHRHYRRMDDNGRSHWCGGAPCAFVHSKTGRKAEVASSSASAFQGLITWLEAHNYKIDFMGGWRRGSCLPPRHKHPCGGALDINQLGRNVVTHRFPAGTAQEARRLGLLHGAEWNWADTGHFEVISNSRYAGRVAAIH